ncbi:TIGR00730 family Rossman fold protein [Candidatus Saccharibacteria bacterium]|nr:TIGR00730 family Rossman fold protein [Candidatus Saccharibacteria bacterium]
MASHPIDANSSASHEAAERNLIIHSIIQERINHEDTDRIKRYVDDLEQGLRKIRTFAQGVSVFGSARIPDDNKYILLAEQLGFLLAQNGHAVITGGGPSIMQAANKGAYEAGGRSIGLNITLPHEQHLNPYVTDSITFHHFFARKVMLTFASKVYVFFPGGFGTLDEFTEILCLIQEKKMPKMPMFLIGKSFWKPLDRFFESKLQKSFHTINPADRKLYKITDDITDVVKAANKIGHPSIYDNLYNDTTKHT